MLLRNVGYVLIEGLERNAFRTSGVAINRNSQKYLVNEKKPMMCIEGLLYAF